LKKYFSFFEKELRDVDLSREMDFVTVVPYSPGPKELKGSDVIKGFENNKTSNTWELQL
jgi:hypothetical protein